MPIIDEGMREMFLNVLFRGAARPATWEVALFAGDPTLGGVELSDETELDEPVEGSAVAATDVVTVVGHGWSDDQKISFSAAPGGLTPGVEYFVRDATTDTFKVAATPGGAALDITADAAAVEVLEIQPNGYARVTVDNDATFWAAAGAGGVPGYLTSIAPVQFPDVTSDEGYDDEVTHWALFDPVSGLWGPSHELAEPLNVTAPGPGPAVSLTEFIDDSVETP